MNNTITVTTTEELKKAKSHNYETIIVKGELADKIYKARNVKKLSAAGVALLTAAIGGIALTPFTGGFSGFMGASTATGVALAAGLSTTAVVAVVSIVAGGISLTLLIAIYKNYNIKVKVKSGNKVVEIELNKEKKEED